MLWRVDPIELDQQSRHAAASLAQEGVAKFASADETKLEMLCPVLADLVQDALRATIVQRFGAYGA